MVAEYRKRLLTLVGYRGLSKVDEDIDDAVHEKILPCEMSRILTLAGPTAVRLHRERFALQ